MIKFILKGHNLPHEVQTIVQVFYPNRHYYETDKISDETYTVISILENGVNGAELYDCGKFIGRYEESFDESEIVNIKEKKRKIKTAIFRLLTKITGYTPVWGILTGIRPAKTVNDLIDDGMTEKEALDFLCEKYFVSEEKAKLSIKVALEERNILKLSNKDDISIYIGIPFCPTRCLYCSFTSYPLFQYKNKVDKYIDTLIKEIEFISSYTSKYNVKNIYIGGGTPTSLNEEQLERLLTAVDNNFDVKNTVEYTVEAGRPDTITEQKLVIMKNHNVSRISINPQTMNQKTLDLIGRKHTVEDIKYIFEKAREIGHNNINMDIILGLPEEKAEDVAHTMEEIMKLSPENVTVHTLAVKRASRLKEQFDLYTLTSLEEMEKMLSVSYKYAEKMGLKPYYMYRQKNMVGSFENVGYCKEGTEGIYNVEIMEENQTIFGCGAGATTKTVDKETGRIERIFNVKSVDDYISRIDEMLDRKKKDSKGFKEVLYMLTQVPRGTRDIFGAEIKEWQKVEAKIREICESSGIEEIRTPVFEHTELFLRGVGETTDIVNKEMYTFNDKGDRSITLRPESTAGIARAYIEHGMHNMPQPIKLYYLSAPTFRYEKAQAGRQRQFHQFGVEMLGSLSPAQDAEAISVAARLIESLGIKDIELRLNSLGCPECRERYNKALRDFIGENLENLCPTCKERYEKNPLRVLDCKEEKCKKIIENAPSVLECLDEECTAHFEKVQEILTEMGIKFVVDPMIVRGLDYYTRTVFEFVTNSIGAQGTVCGGGRYDKLIEECGGQSTGAVGFGLGMERLLLTLEAQSGKFENKPQKDIYIGAIGEKGFVKAQAITYNLRKEGIKAECDTVGRSVKAQMKYANKIGAKYSVIIGDTEIEEDRVSLKNMEEGNVQEIKLSEILNYIAH